MNLFNAIQLKTLDRHLREVKAPEIPSGGWAQAIRSALGMSLQQAAARIGIAKQSLARLEQNELDNAITLKSLRKVAASLNCRLIYALVPINEDGLQGIVQKQATRKATEIVSDVDHTMQLEAQGVGHLNEKIKEIADALSKNPNSKLWE